MALCYFCKRADFANGQAVRAHLRACGWYQARDREQTLYRVTRALGALDAPVGATEAQHRARWEEEQVAHGRRPPPRALCAFCGRVDFRNGQAVRAHLQRCPAYRAAKGRL